MLPPLRHPLIEHGVVYGNWLLDSGRSEEAAEFAAAILATGPSGLGGETIAFIARCHVAGGHMDEARALIAPLAAGRVRRTAGLHDALARVLDALGDREGASIQRQLKSEAVAFTASVVARQAGEHERLRQEVEERRARSEPVRLHFGCGHTLIDGFINLDHAEGPGISTIPGIFQRHDFFVVALGPLPINANAVDYIFHEDFIEHVSQATQVSFLAECLRILKPGAVHRISTPDLRGDVGRYSQFEQGWAGVWNYEWDTWGHVSLFSPSSLADMAMMVGYAQVLLTEKNQSTSPFRCLEQRPLGDREASANIFADLIK